MVGGAIRRQEARRGWLESCSRSDEAMNVGSWAADRTGGDIGKGVQLGDLGDVGSGYTFKDELGDPVPNSYLEVRVAEVEEEDLDRATVI